MSMITLPATVSIPARHLTIGDWIDHDGELRAVTQKTITEDPYGQRTVTTRLLTRDPSSQQAIWLHETVSLSAQQPVHRLITSAQHVQMPPNPEGVSLPEHLPLNSTFDLQVKRLLPDMCPHQADQIPSLHLAVREGQVARGENTFTNIRDSQAELTDIQGAYIDRGGMFLIALSHEHDQVVGFVGLRCAGRRNDGGAYGEIKRLTVLPAFRRNGIATRLIGELISMAVRDRYVRIVLRTNIGEAARPIYEHHGFTVVGFQSEHEDWLMEHNLPISTTLPRRLA